MRNRALLTFVLFACAFVAGPARAETPLTVRMVRERIAAAMGTRPPSYREIEDLTRGGAPSRISIAGAGEDVRTTFEQGTLHAERGVFGGRHWLQNENGETILLRSSDDAEEGAGEAGGGGIDSADEERVTTLSRVAAPVDGYLLSSLDASGYGSKRYVDATTWRVVRRDEIDGRGTTVTLYDDFRTVDGFTQSFHRTSTDGHPEDDEDEHVVAFGPATVPPADVAIPAATRTLVEFPTGKTTVALPVREEHHEFVVRVTIGTRGLDFLLDSGSSGIVLESGVAQQLGLRELRSYANAGNAGRVRETTTVVPEMHVGELSMHDVVVDTVPSLEGRSELGDYRIVGLLGFDFIADVLLKLDYLHETMTASAPKSFEMPADANGFAVDLRLDDQIPLVNVTVNGETGTKFLIDSGAYGSLVFFDRFTRRHAHALIDEGHGAGRDVRLSGIGGELRTKPYQLKTVRFGSVNFHDYVALAVGNRDAYRGLDGTIGPEFLQLFDVYLDYANQKAYFIFNAG